MNTSTIRFKVLDSQKINIRYFMYYLKSNDFKEQLSKYITGSAQLNYGPSHLKKMTMPYIDLQKQNIVVKHLDKIQRIINLRQQQLVKLDVLVKARFVEVFGDPKINDKGWKRGFLADYFDVKGGKRIPKGMGYSDIKTNHPYLRATDMKNEPILEDDIHYISEDVFQHIKRYTVNGGDIYLTNVGVHLGMAGVIPQKFDGASLTENAVKLVQKNQKGT